MTLPELVSPVFLFAAALQRKIRRKVPLDYGDVKREVQTMFAQIESRASQAAMTDKWNRVKPALAYLVDEIAIMEAWPGRDNWNAHPLEIEYLGHTERMRGAWFYDQDYKQALDSGDVEWIEILYTCLCLGFEGRFRGQTAQIKNHADNLYARLPAAFRDPNEADRLFPGCYHVDRIANHPRAAIRLATVITLFVGIIASYFVVSYFLFDRFTNELGNIVSKLQKDP